MQVSIILEWVLWRRRTCTVVLRWGILVSYQGCSSKGADDFSLKLTATRQRPPNPPLLAQQLHRTHCFIHGCKPTIFRNFSTGIRETTARSFYSTGTLVKLSTTWIDGVRHCRVRGNSRIGSNRQFKSSLIPGRTEAREDEWT